MFDLDYYLIFGIMIGSMSVGPGVFGVVSFGNTALASTSAPPVGQAASRALAPSASPSGKESMDPSLLAHFMGAGVPDTIIEQLGSAGVKSLA